MILITTPSFVLEQYSFNLVMKNMFSQTFFHGVFMVESLYGTQHT